MLQFVKMLFDALGTMLNYPIRIDQYTIKIWYIWFFPLVCVLAYKILTNLTIELPRLGSSLNKRMSKKKYEKLERERRAKRKGD